MLCTTCHDLLAAYKSAVRLYTNTGQRLRGLVGDEFHLIFKELKRLRFFKFGSQSFVDLRQFSHLTAQYRRLRQCRFNRKNQPCGCEGF